MAMANGTATQQEKKLQFKPRKTSTEIQPDAPEGEWTFLIPKGKCKGLVTQKGDPRLIIPHKLVEAADEKNEAHQGSEVNQSIIIFDDEDAEKRRGANMMKGRLRSLCEAVDVDFAEVYPTELTGNMSDFDGLFAALEGKKGTCWTVHTRRQGGNGDDVVDTEIRYSKPGAGLVTKDVEDDDEEAERPGASARKAPAKKGGRR
jgi:hypothetical protein